LAGAVVRTARRHQSARRAFLKSAFRPDPSPAPTPGRCSARPLRGAAEAAASVRHSLAPERAGRLRAPQGRLRRRSAMRARRVAKPLSPRERGGVAGVGPASAIDAAGVSDRRGTTLRNWSRKIPNTHKRLGPPGPAPFILPSIVGVVGRGSGCPNLIRLRPAEGLFPSALAQPECQDARGDGNG
jgi:hypothetical protein